MLDKLHHIAILCSSYEKAIAFYGDALGFKTVYEVEREDKEDKIVMLEGKDVRLELFIKPSAPPRPSYPEAQGLRHIAFSVDDVEETVKELLKKGVKAEPVREDSITGEKMTFVHDPDGLPIELHE